MDPLKVLVLFVFLLSPCASITYQFSATAGNNPWETRANWQPNGIPTGADDVIIPYTPSGGYSVSINSEATCNSLFIGGPSSIGAWDPGYTQTLEIVSGTLTISKNCTVYKSGVLTMGGSGLTGLAPNGLVMVLGGFEVGSGGTHTLSTIGILVENGGYLAVAAEPGGIILTNGAKITVATGGNMTLMTQYGINTNDGTPVYLTNYGTIYCQPGSLNNFNTKISVPFSNYGSFMMNSGQIAVSNGSSWYGPLTVAANAAFNITRGVHHFYPSSSISGQGTIEIQNNPAIIIQCRTSISNFVIAEGTVTVDNQQGTSQFSNLVMMQGLLSGTPISIESFTWAGGALSVSDLAINSLQIVGAFTASLTNTALIVSGQATFANTALFLFTNSSFTLGQNAQMTFNNHINLICGRNDTISVIQIAGTLTISYSSPITLTCPLVIFNSGVIHSTAGLLDVQTPVTSTGTLNIDAGATVILETTSTFFMGSSILGSGTLNCQSCTAFISGKINLGTLQFPAGSITVSVEYGTTDYVATLQHYNQSGSSSLVLTNNSPANLNFTVANMVYAGGNVSSNHNTQLGVQANLIITNSSIFTGSRPYLFINVALINYGITSFLGGGSLELWQSNVIHNTPSGLIQVVGGSLDVSQNDQLGFVSVLKNEGTLTVNLGASAEMALSFNNLGSVVVNGQLDLVYGFYTQFGNGVTQVAQTGSIIMANPGSFMGGTITGKGIIEGTVTLAGATLNIDDSTNLTVSTFLVRAGTVEVDVASTSTLKVQSLCQITGGNIVLYSSKNVPLSSPYSKQYLSAPSVTGSGFDSIANASLNSTTGFWISNTTAGLYASLVPQPTISQVTPSQGEAGTVITITGTNFIIGQSALNISVLFQGIAVPATVITRLSVTAIAPVLTGTVNVAILVDGRISQVVQWTYSPSTLQSITPQNGPTTGSNLVTISGANFGTDASQVSVTFGTFGACPITVLANNQIVCTVPPGIGANVSVSVQVGQQKNSSLKYSYYAPVIQSVYPSVLLESEGQSNTGTITVTGQSLAPSPSGSSNVTIQIGEYNCGNVTQVSLTSFTCSPPSSLLTGEDTAYPIKAIVAGQSSSNLTFNVVYSKSQKSSSNWWPFPYWIWLIVAGALVVFLLIGIFIGFKVSSGGNKSAYEPISSESQQSKRTSVINY